MFETFAKKGEKENPLNKKAETKDTKGKASVTQKGSLGVLGATPLDILTDGEKCLEKNSLETYYINQGYETVFVYGMGSGLEAVKRAGETEKNLVIAPAGLAAARYLQKEYGVPYEAEYPLELLPGWQELSAAINNMKGKKVLIVHQQVLANTLRKEILSRGSADVTVASWFALEKEWKQEKDVLLKEEDQWVSLIDKNEYDWIIGDGLLERALTDYKGHYWNLPHFAVSGKR